MRLIADAASKRETLTDAAAQGMACFIAEETLARVDVSLSAGESDAQTAAELLHLPDETLSRLEEDETLSDILADVQTRARRAVSALSLIHIFFGDCELCAGTGRRCVWRGFQ